MMAAVNAGDLVGARFRIERRVAAGGMGIVYRAIDEETGFAVAVKVFNIRSEIDVERAHRESQLLARLAHPAIVAHIDDGVTDDGRLYLAMEWIEGVTVLGRIANQGFSPREVVALGRRVAGALAAVHGLGILHRDVKPSNVLLPDNQADTAMLIDFGVARVGSAAATSLTRTGIAIGTPGYMSPEQARGDKELTPAVDVFALGCVLYECATGDPAFSGTTPAAIMAKILFADIAPVSAVCPDVPVELSQVIERMMARETEQRYPDAKAVADALDGVGKLSDGARRVSSRRVPNKPKAQVHCMVMATAVPHPHAPEAEIYAALVEAADLWDARLELFETGELCAHLQGDPRQTTHRAACLALAMRKLLPGWTIAISNEQDEAAAAAETGSVMLTSASLATVFKRIPGGAIVIDHAMQPVLEQEFEITPNKAAAPTLIGKRPMR
jgi:hypothetical protein